MSITITQQPFNRIKKSSEDSINLYNSKRSHFTELKWIPILLIDIIHRHLSNIECLTACTACPVCFISTVNGRRKKEANYDWC
jgi:hypothetical protein